MKLPKIPIDHSKAGTGEAPYDGSKYLLHGDEIVVCAKYYTGCDLDIECYFEDDFQEVHDFDNFTHYTPMPEFEEVKS